jgi:hypothetical protein
MKNLKPILYAGALAGALDITAACIQVYVEFGMTPVRLLQGVASAILGRAAALNGGFPTAALGLVMHFTMALTVATIFYALSRRLPLPQKFLGVVVVGLLYGAAVFAVNNFGTAPLLSWVRSLYLHTPVLFKPPMGLSQLVIHLFCVGLPIALVIHQYTTNESFRGVEAVKP